MTREVITQILDAVDALPTDDATKAEFRKAVRGICNAHGFQWLDRDDRLRFVRELLLRKVSRSTIKDRLMACYGISRCHAYRSIAAALKLSQNQRPNATRLGFNEASELNSTSHEKPD